MQEIQHQTDTILGAPGTKQSMMMIILVIMMVMMMMMVILNWIEITNATDGTKVDFSDGVEASSCFKLPLLCPGV